MPRGVPAQTSADPTLLPSEVTWVKTTIIHKGGFAGSPIPAWALASVQDSYDAFKANGATDAARESTLASEVQAKAVLHQLRRASNQLGFGLAARVDGPKLVFQAKDKKIVTSKASVPA